MGRKKEIIRELRASILLKDSIIDDQRSTVSLNNRIIQTQRTEIENMRRELVRLEKENAALIQERDSLANPNQISIVQGATEKVVYVLGFAFNTDMSKVLLIEKTKPYWQAGKLNGLGGKLEEGETINQAMVREFSEECGLSSNCNDWSEFAVMYGPGWECHCLSEFKDEFHLLTSRDTTEEKLQFTDVDSLENKPTLSNVPWLVRLALDCELSGNDFHAIVNYK